MLCYLFMLHLVLPVSYPPTTIPEIICYFLLYQYITSEGRVYSYCHTPNHIKEQGAQFKNKLNC